MKESAKRRMVKHGQEKEGKFSHQQSFGSTQNDNHFHQEIEEKGPSPHQKTALAIGKMISHEKPFAKSNIVLFYPRC